jgi:hypothetical protein
MLGAGRTAGAGNGGGSRSITRLTAACRNDRSTAVHPRSEQTGLNGGFQQLSRIGHP